MGCDATVIHVIVGVVFKSSLLLRRSLSLLSLSLSLSDTLSLPPLYLLDFNAKTYPQGLRTHYKVSLLRLSQSHAAATGGGGETSNRSACHVLAVV